MLNNAQIVFRGSGIGEGEKQPQFSRIRSGRATSVQKYLTERAIGRRNRATTSLKSPNFEKITKRMHLALQNKSGVKFENYTNIGIIVSTKP